MKIFLFSTILTLSFCSLYAQEWQLAAQKEGVTVYTKQSESSAIKSFKAEKELAISIEKVLEAIIDVNGQANWYDHCIAAALLFKESDSLVYHMEFAMPFPFSNRDVVNSMVVKKTINGHTIQFEQISDVKQEVDGLVRMPISTGNWTLTLSPNGGTYVSHQYQGDPGGNIPASMVNMLIVSGPINTLTRLEKYLE